MFDNATFTGLINWFIAEIIDNTCSSIVIMSVISFFYIYYYMRMKLNIKLNPQSHPNSIKKEKKRAALPGPTIKPCQSMGLGLSHYHAMLQNGLELKPFLASCSRVKGSCQSQCCLKNGVGGGGWGGSGVWLVGPENRLLREAILHSIPIGQGAIIAPLWTGAFQCHCSGQWRPIN